MKISPPGPEPRGIRVLMLGPDLDQSVGGVQTHATNFLSAFQHHPTVQLEYFPTSLGLHKNETLTRKLSRMVRLLPDFLDKALECDIVHLNCSFGTAPMLRDCIYGLAATRIRRKPVVLQFHGGLASEMRSLSNPLLRWFFERCMAHASTILVLSQEQRKAASKIFPALKFTTVGNFVEIPVRLPPRNLEGPLKFLFLARVSRSKGLAHVLDAAELLAAEGHSFDVAVCGDGPDTGWLISEIATRHLGVHVRFCGTVRGREKGQYLEQSHALLLPTEHREGMPYGVLEAFSYAMPVIATRKGAIEDIVIDGVTGYLIGKPVAEQLADRMRTLIQRPARIAEMGRAARKKAEEDLSFDSLLATFLGIYGEMLNSSDTGTSCA